MEGLSSHQPTCSASKDAQSLPGFLSTKGRHLRKGETGQRHLYGTTAELEQPAKRLCRAGGVSRQESRPHEIRLPVGTAGIQPLRDSSAFEPSAQAEQLVCGRRICVDLDPSGGSGGRQEAEALVCRWDLSSAALVIACQLQFSSWVHAEAEGRVHPRLGLALPTYLRGGVLGMWVRRGCVVHVCVPVPAQNRTRGCVRARVFAAACLGAFACVDASSNF